ncbi:response regulator receiver domain [Vibrio cyclitrophicus]|uniref:response regulator receiver domain n=1 Tax=Vibrio cyclitrophicus TaxID=47951 RepID=UPI00029A4891|nr:response regulator receiver domain [Vibrio cyclitrophicus]OEE30117.1 hypothetical protein OAM_01635 [Vibrio cyclitrophicus ZF14]
MLANFNYTPFLKQAYIDPIRTVTVIDDEYPTLEELVILGNEDFGDDDLDRLYDIIEISRKKEFNWLLDVYNGGEDSINSGSITSRLNHSDLLILDYHLDGNDDGYCKKSIDIVKNLSSNRHFNLVAVHTKGYDNSKGAVNDVFIDIIISLQPKPRFLNINKKTIESIEEQLDEWSFEHDDISQDLVDSISTIDLLMLIRDHSNQILNPTFDHAVWNHFTSIYQDKPEDIEISKPNLVKWLCNKKFEAYEGCFKDKPAEFFDWGIDNDTNWVKTEDLFLTVIGKKKTPVSEIPTKILHAINQSKPHPHELILSKLRNEVESNGISASSKILQRKFLQAAWLTELLKEDTDQGIMTVSWSVVSKLWEELAQEIRPQIGEFTVELVKGLKTIDDPLACFLEEHTRENKNQIVQHANCFSCSKKISYHHLITGHVVLFKDNYWLCLTPMCDLVPGQKSDSSLMPVTLVQMYDAKVAHKVTRENMAKALGVDLKDLPKLSDTEVINQIIEYSTENNLLFIAPQEDKGEVKILSFTYGLDGKSNPKAKDYYIENHGLFDPQTKELNIQYVEPSAEQGKNDLQQLSGKAVVVAELRYEYALNLLRKLGVARSRVGLDFIR